MDLRAICLFSGPGGGSLGLERAGFRVVLAVDYDADAIRTHQMFSPGVPTAMADLSKVHPAEVLLQHGIVPGEFSGIILCSPPCQGFANCGRRDADAETNDLLQAVAKISQSCPRAWIVVENVRGLLALRNRRRLLGMLDALRADGRDVPTVAELREQWILDAQFYSCPQHRERVFVVAPPAYCCRIPIPEPTTPVPPTLESVIGFGSGFVDPDPRAITLTPLEAACHLKKENTWVGKYLERLGHASKLIRGQHLDKPCHAITAFVSKRSRGRVALVHPSEARRLSVGERMAVQRLPLNRGPIPAETIVAHRLVGDAIPSPLAEAVARGIRRAMEDWERGDGMPATPPPGHLPGNAFSAVSSSAPSAATAAKCAKGVDPLTPANLPTATALADLKSPVLIVENSDNKKIGEHCSATYVSQATCPSSCVFRGAGCYAETGNCGNTTRRLNESLEKNPVVIAKIEAAEIDALNGTNDLRVHVVGDCPNSECAEVVGAAMQRFEERTGCNAWTYSHAWRDIPAEKWCGANVLASCESIEQVKQARTAGYATSVVIPKHSGSRAYELDGIKCVPCPQQTRGITCEKCRMCMRADKLKAAAVTIVFDAHGASAARAVRVIEQVARREMDEPATVTATEPKTDSAVQKSECLPPIGQVTPAALSVPESIVRVSLAPTEANTEIFKHIYDRDDQIAVVLSAIRAAHESKFLNRHHVVLHGPPGCGKTEILRACGTMLGEANVLELDATALTTAGAERVLLESAENLKFLLIEELEKKEESALRWLLGILDTRGEIRKTNCRGDQRRTVKLLCVATVNDFEKFDSLLAGALASRFPNRVYCPRPNRNILERIVRREINKVGGDVRWIAPAIDYCLNVGGTDDPRRIISVCMCGGDALLTGEYQKRLQATQEPALLEAVR